MGEDDNQALMTHAKDTSKKEEHSHKKHRRFQKNHKPQKDYLNFSCYSCDEKGHLAIDFLEAKAMKINEIRRGMMLMLQKMMNRLRREQGKIPQVMENMYFDQEEFIA